MATDSSSAGYLSPTGDQPPYDEELDQIFHDAIMALTGLQGRYVRPRWQPDPPNQPEFSVNWVAFGVNATTPDSFSYNRFDSTSQSEQVQRDELLEVFLSFYGPQAMSTGERFRDGLMVAQNRDMLRGFNIALVSVKEPLVIPALVKEKWVKRVDIRSTFRRRIARSYKVLSLLSGQLQIDAEVTETNIIISNQ